MSKAVLSRLVNKYRTKGTVEADRRKKRPNKSTPHTDPKIIRYLKTNPFTRDIVSIGIFFLVFWFFGFYRTLRNKVQIFEKI